MACCTASHWTAASLVADHGVAAEKVHVVGLGPNHEPAGGAGAGADAAPRFLFVGREWERKHGPLLLRAFARLRAEIPDARLDLVGGASAGERARRDGARAAGLDRPDEAARVSALFGAATCFVMPSEVEPFGLAYIEAAVAGVPSIATSVGGAGTIVAEGTGLLVPPGDEEALLRCDAHARRPGRWRGGWARRRASARGCSRGSWSRARLLRALGLPGGEGAEYL